MQNRSSVEYSVSEITRERLAEIAAVERECFSTPWSEDALMILTEKPNIGFYAECDGRIVGYGGMQCVLDEGQITDIAVLPSYRRRGIAAAILGALLDFAKKSGLSVIFLEARESNLPAISLYRDRFGFEVIGIRKNFYSHPRENALNMRLLLGETVF